MMERFEVDSSMILAVSFDREAEVLDVEMWDGSILRHMDVPWCIVEALLEADSKGRFYNFLIRGAFETRWVREVGGRPAQAA